MVTVSICLYIKSAGEKESERPSAKLKPIFVPVELKIINSESKILKDFKNS